MTRAPSLDRRIVLLAIPALGSLVAEPLYLLVDTAIVGHLGTTELAALAIASQVLLTIVNLCVFLAYGTTTHVASSDAPARRAQLGVQGLWLGAATGAVVVAVLLAFAGPITRGLAGESEAASLAARYLRISAVGVAAQLVMTAGQGWLRGRELLGVALRLVLAGQLVNLLVTAGLVYIAGLGLDGAALGTVAAQLAMAGATIWLVAREARGAHVSLLPSATLLRTLAHFGGLLVVRSVALSGAYLFVAAAAARISDPSVAAHQVAMQLVWLIALALDALAIAAQVLVAGALGRREHDAAVTIAWRVSLWSLGFGVLGGAVLLALGPQLVVGFFSPDPAVAAAASELWPWLCALQVVGGLAFAFDGILIGAHAGRWLALSTIAGAAALAGTAALIGTGELAALWTAVGVMFVVRAAVLGARLAGGALRVAPRPTPA